MWWLAPRPLIVAETTLGNRCLVTEYLIHNNIQALQSVNTSSEEYLKPSQKVRKSYSACMMKEQVNGVLFDIRCYSKALQGYTIITIICRCCVQLEIDRRVTDQHTKMLPKEYT